ncbi:MAG: JAB domain-containing protein, partial [Tannerellaceae bacterium]
MDDKRKVLYESLSGDGYDLGDFSSFSEKMNNPEKRKALYDAVGADYDLGDYDTFESKLGYKEATDAALGAKNEVAPVAEQTVQSPVELHVAEQPVAEQPASLSEEELDGLYTGGNRETMLKQAKEAKERASKSLGDALNKDFDEQIRFQREHPILSALAGTRKSVDSPLTRNKDVRDLTATVDKAEKAIDLIGEANKKGSTNFFAGFGRGFWNTVTDPNTFSMGSVDMALNHSLMQAAKKYEAGEQLSDNEQLLMDTYALNAAVQQDARPDLGRGYKAGMVTGEMAPFMAEMALNPASGLGKGIMKQAVKKFGKEGMSALARNSIKISSRVAGDIVGASIMAGTTGSMQVGAGAMDRHTGGAIPTFTDEGYVRFDGTEQGDDVMTSLAKEYGSQTIERWSEMVGEGFNFAGKLAGAGAAKALNKMGLSKVNDMITSIKASDVAKVVDDFASKTQWNGVFGEFMEEQVGLVANSLTVGDSKLSDLWNWDQQLDTFLGVSVFGGFMSGVKSFGYRAPGYDARKRVSRANKAASKVFGEKWDNLSIILDEAEGAEDYAKALSTLRGDELRAALGYVSALEAGKGASIAELKRKTEGDIPDERLEIEGSFDAGYQEEAPEAIQSAYAIEREALNKRRETLGELLEEELGDIINANPLSAVGEIMQHKELTDDEKEECIDAILAHANAQAKIKGIKAKFADNLEGKIEQAYDYIDGIKHEDGNVYDFTMKENDDKHVNLIKGNVTIGEDGIIDTQKSDPFVFVKDASGVRMLSPHELFKRSSVQSSQELKQITGQTIMEQEYGVMEALESTPSEQEVNNTVASYEPGQEITLYPNGQPINATVQTAVNEEGRIQLMFDSPIEMNGQQVQVAEFSSEELGNLLNPQEVIDSNLPENNTQSEVAPPVEDGTMTEEQLQEVWKQKQAEIEQGNTKAEVISTPSFPTDKSGNIDYAQIEDNQMYADALESEFGEEAASIIDDELAVQEKKLKAAENKGTAIERARAKKAITQEIERLNGIKGLIPSYIAKQQKENEALQTEAAAKQEEEHNVMGNASHNEQLRYIAENSEDVNQILAAFEEAKELSEVSTLEPWEDALLTYQVKQASFEQFGDKNNITGTLARAWFSKNAKSVDQVAAELSAVTGKTITDQDVVDFITSHPSRNARKTSDEQRLLSRRFSEVASKITGTPVGGPESATGRVFVKMQQGMQTQAAVSSAIVDNASEQIEGVATSETFDADLYAMYEAESFEPSDAEVEQYLNILNNEQRNVQNEVSTGEASQGEPVMQDARETAGSQEEGGSGTSNRGSEKATTEVGIFAAAQTAIDNHNASKPVRSAEKEVDTNPTEAQKEAGNYKMGHTTLDGRNVTIENPKGSVRSGVDADGKAWSQEMKNTYGYFRRTEGNDGDHVDVFIGDKLASGKVFVVDQIDKDGLFDEHKVMYGFDSKEDAEAAYLSNYEEGWQGLGAITEFEKESFFDWLDNEDKSKPVSYEETLTPKMIYGEYMDMAKEEGEEPISYDEFMEELSKPESSKEVYNFFVDKYGKDFSDAISLDNFTSMFAKKEDVEMIELTPENIHKAISDYAEKNEFDSFPYDEFIGLMSNAESRKDAYDVLSEIFGDKFTKNFTLDDLADLFAKNESETVATEEIAKGDVENKEDFLTPTGIYNAYAKIQSDKGIIPLSYNEFISKMSNKEAATRLHVILGSNRGDEFSKAVTAKEFVDVLVKNKKEMLADNKEEIREEDKTEGVNSNEPAPSESSNEEVAPTEIEAEEKKDPLLESKYLGKLKKGEFCHVERVFSESKAFSFTGKDKVETIDDVAFIFRQLENSSIENSFAVLVKDGEATVLHLGMGSFDQTVANTDAIYAAFNRIPCDDIYFVHNHPSGNLVSSGADRQMYRKLKGIYGDKMKPAIIINITSGKYGLFDSTDESFGKIPESDNTDMPLRTYTFDKYVFEEGFNPEDKPTVTSIKDVASFVSSHRLGKRNKLSALILSQSGRIVGNVFLPYANVTAKNRSKIVSYLKERVVNLGGASAILYGRAGNLDDSLRKEARKNDLQILDVVDVENYLEKSNSLSEEGALKIEDETKALKLKEKEVLTTPYMADSKKEISEAAEELAKELGEEIEIIARDEMPEGHKRAQGYYNPRTGKITVCPENHNSVEDVRRTIFHEAVAHKGLSGLFGESFDDFLKDTYKNASSDVRDRINRMASRNGWDIKLATEEYLAMQAERGFDDSLMSMVRELFNGMISKAKKALGFKLNDSDIRYVLWKSYRNMKGKGGSIIDIAEDIAIKNKLFDKTSERVFNAKFGSEEVKFRERTDPAPTKTGIGYKVFVLKQGKLYPP